MSHNRKPGRAFTYIIYPKITVLPKSLLYVCYTRCKPTTAELPCIEQDSSRKVGSAWGHKTVGMSDFMTPPKIMGKEGIQKCSRCYRNVTKLLETCVPEPLGSGSGIICVISSSSPPSLLDNLGSTTFPSSVAETSFMKMNRVSSSGLERKTMKLHITQG